MRHREGPPCRKVLRDSRPVYGTLGPMKSLSFTIVCGLLPGLLASGCAGPRPITVAAVSCESRIQAKEHNLTRIEHWARRAAGSGADLVLFPECAVHGWWQSRESRRHTEPVDGPSIHRLVGLAGELDLVLAVGMTERDGDKVYISHVVLDGEGVIGTHRKSSLAGGKQGEAAVWDRGNDAHVFQVHGHTIGIAICFESVHPGTCRALTSRGARIILAPYANGTDPAEIIDPERKSRRWIWKRVQENHVWYVACDATPHNEDGSLRPGAAFVIDPDGELVACTPPDVPGEAMVVVTIPPETP